MAEVWKFYKETNSKYGHRIYEVSDQGRVKINSQLQTKFNTNSAGYFCIGGFFVHRAVAELFVPNPENKSCVDHIDTNKHNNAYWNLRWVTYKENCNNPLTRKHNSRAQKVAQNRPEVKQKHSEATTEAWSNLENKQKLKESHNNPQTKQKHSEASKKNWKNPKFRQKINESLKVAQNRPEVKQKRSESLKGRICINKNNEEKRVKPDQLDLFLNDGWKTGRK